MPETRGGAAVPEIVKTRGVAVAPAGNKRTPVKPDLTEAASRGEKQRFVKKGGRIVQHGQKGEPESGPIFGPVVGRQTVCCISASTESWTILRSHFQAQILYGFVHFILVFYICFVTRDLRKCVQPKTNENSARHFPGIVLSRMPRRGNIVAIMLLIMLQTKTCRTIPKLV